jgi:uncharacterized protein
VSPTVAVFATLGLILVVPRKVPMWISFLGACLVLPLLAGKGFAGSWELWVEAVAQANWLFVAFCAGVFVLSSILTHGGHLAVLCDFATALIPSRKVRVALMPALVGLVPMPGGAVVSAPLIDRSLGDTDLPAADKNLINYWFRHIWEVSWPLYPAVLFATGLLHENEDETFFLAQGALTVVLAAAGFVVLLRRVPKEAGSGVLRRPSFAKSRAVIPLLALVVVPLLLRAGGANPGAEFTLDDPIWQIAGTVIVAIVLALLTTIDVAGLSKVPFDRRIYSMTALALLVSLFGDLVQRVDDGMLGADLPFWAFALLVPFVVGFSTGATLTFATVALPLVYAGTRGAVESGGAGHGDLVPWLVLAYAGGFLGYLTSPVHMCLVLSTRYFNAKLLSAYARLALPLAAFLAAAVGLFLALGGRFET